MIRDVSGKRRSQKPEARSQKKTMWASSIFWLLAPGSWLLASSPNRHQVTHLHLRLVKLGVDAIGLVDQVTVQALLDQLALLEHDQTIGGLKRAEAVSD